MARLPFLAIAPTGLTVLYVFEACSPCPPALSMLIREMRGYVAGSRGRRSRETQGWVLEHRWKMKEKKKEKSARVAETSWCVRSFCVAAHPRRVETEGTSMARGSR
jgi:hypothetical protein